MIIITEETVDKKLYLFSSQIHYNCNQKACLNKSKDFVLKYFD